MATFSEMIEGLQKCRSYKCGSNHLTLTEDGQIKHTVLSFTALGGSGGVAYLSIPDIDIMKDRWPQDGWQELSKKP